MLLRLCHLLADIKVLPPRQAHQLVWSRFVNVHGCNIPCDLYMERLCQDCIRHLGANKTEKAICRPSKCMSFLSNIIDRFNKEHKCYHSSGTHSSISSEKDRDMIIKELMKCSVFKHKSCRYHASFEKFICNPIKALDYRKIRQWLTQHTKGKGTITDNTI